MTGDWAEAEVPGVSEPLSVSHLRGQHQLPKIGDPTCPLLWKLEPGPVQWLVASPGQGRVQWADKCMLAAKGDME